jgi:hypothetical protein
MVCTEREGKCLGQDSSALMCATLQEVHMLNLLLQILSVCC